jgi:hypothetical protein
MNRAMPDSQRGRARAVRRPFDCSSDCHAVGSRSAPRISRRIRCHELTSKAIRSTRRATLRPKKERSLYAALPDNLLNVTEFFPHLRGFFAT